MFHWLTLVNAALLAADFWLFRSRPALIPVILSINFCLSLTIIANHHKRFTFSKTTYEQDFLRVAGACVVALLLLMTIPVTFSLPTSLLVAALISFRWSSSDFRVKAISSLKFDTSFNDVLVADALTSFARPLSLSFESKHLKYLIYSFPYLIRIKQCLQDKRPSSRFNLIKYLLLLSSAYILFNRAQFPFFVMILPLLTAIYASWWDTLMDWGYSKSHFAVLPLIINSVIRLVPILAPALHPLVGCGLEVYRRAMWSHLRLLYRDRTENIYRTI